MEPATFRPALRALGPRVLLGAVAGAALGVVLEVPLLLGALFGGVAAAIVLTAQNARGLRVIVDDAGLRVRGGAADVEARWPEVRLGFGLAQRGDGRLQRYAIVADALGRSFAFGDALGGASAGAVRGADGREVPLVDLRDAPLLLAVLVQRIPTWNVLPESLQAPPRASEALVEVEGASAAAAEP